MTKEEFTCGFCYRPHIGTNLPPTWDIVWQTPVCPACQKRVAEDGGYEVVKLGTYAAERTDLLLEGIQASDWNEDVLKTPASIPQPPPAPGKTVVLDQVLKDIQERSDTGLRKYGVRLQTNNGRDALWDSYQEAIDLVMYLRQALLEQEGK